MLLEKLIQFSNENVINITQQFKHKKKTKDGTDINGCQPTSSFQNLPFPTSTLDSVLHY